MTTEQTDKDDSQCAITAPRNLNGGRTFLQMYNALGLTQPHELRSLLHGVSFSSVVVLSCAMHLLPVWFHCVDIAYAAKTYITLFINRGHIFNSHELDTWNI